jgi:hypothetical protein
MGSKRQLHPVSFPILYRVCPCRQNTKSFLGGGLRVTRRKITSPDYTHYSFFMPNGHAMPTCTITTISGKQHDDDDDDDDSTVVIGRHGTGCRLVCEIHRHDYITININIIIGIIDVFESALRPRVVESANGMALQRPLLPPPLPPPRIIVVAIIIPS